MEKSTPHCKLAVVQALVVGGHVRATASAFGGALELGINDLAGMCAVVMSLTSANFYKSMTTHADHRIWQEL
jgi:motility quorum-sensing regulator/GCU-specific mRNA interferase toxin